MIYLVMLRNRSKTMVMKHEQQPSMVDHQSVVPTKQNLDKKPFIKTFLSSPRFKAFTTKISDEATNLIITRYQPPPPLMMMMIFPFNNNKSPTALNSNQSLKDEKNKQSLDGCNRIGLALADDTNEYKNTIFEDYNDDEKMILFGTDIKVQPVLSAIRQSDHYHPDEFRAKPVVNGCIMVGGFGSAGVQTGVEEEGCNGLDGMELSEDYTCVIFHGDNPKTTHFFDNSTLENYCCLSDEYSMSATKDDDDDDFLRFCYTCRKKLQQKDDIYIYRGEKAFCSCECRYEEILLDGDDN